MTEIWEDIKGYEGLYQVSSHGRIKSLDRRVRCGYNLTRVIKESIKKLHFSEENKQYSTQLRKDGKTTHFLLARLVADAFIDNPENLPWLIFADGNKLNCHASNLMYVSRDERLEVLRNNRPSKPKPWSEERLEAANKKRKEREEAANKKRKEREEAAIKRKEEAAAKRREEDANKKLKKDITNRRRRGETFSSIAKSYGISVYAASRLSY